MINHIDEVSFNHALATLVALRQEAILLQRENKELRDQINTLTVRLQELESGKATQTEVDK